MNSLVCECNGKTYSDSICFTRHQETDTHKRNLSNKLIKERQSYKENVNLIKDELKNLINDFNVIKVDMNAIKINDSVINYVKEDFNAAKDEINAVKVDIKADINAVKADLNAVKGDINSLKMEIIALNNILKSKLNLI